MDFAKVILAFKPGTKISESNLGTPTGLGLLPKKATAKQIEWQRKILKGLAEFVRAGELADIDVHAFKNGTFLRRFSILMLASRKANTG